MDDSNMKSQLKARLKKLKEEIPFLQRQVERLKQSKDGNPEECKKLIVLCKMLKKVGKKSTIKSIEAYEAIITQLHIRYKKYDKLMSTSIDLTEPECVVLSSEESESDIMEIEDDVEIIEQCKSSSSNNSHNSTFRRRNELSPLEEDVEEVMLVECSVSQKQLPIRLGQQQRTSVETQVSETQRSPTYSSDKPAPSLVDVLQKLKQISSKHENNDVANNGVETGYNTATGQLPFCNDSNLPLSININVNRCYDTNQAGNTSQPPKINLYDPRVRRALLRRSAIYTQPSIYPSTNNSVANAQISSRCSQVPYKCQPNAMNAFNQERQYYEQTQPQPRTYLEYKRAKAMAMEKRRQLISKSERRQDVRRHLLAGKKAKENNCNKNKKLDASGDTLDQSMMKTCQNKGWCVENRLMESKNHSNNNAAKFDTNNRSDKNHNEISDIKTINKEVSSKKSYEIPRRKKTKRGRRGGSKTRKQPVLKNITKMNDRDSKKEDDEQTHIIKQVDEPVRTVPQFDESPTNGSSCKQGEAVVSNIIEPPFCAVLPDKNLNDSVVVDSDSEGAELDDELLEVMAKQPILIKPKSKAIKEKGATSRRGRRPGTSRRDNHLLCESNKTNANATVKSALSSGKQQTLPTCLVRLKRVKFPLTQTQQVDKPKPQENDDEENVPLSLRLTKRSKKFDASEFEVTKFFESTPVAELKNTNPSWHALSQAAISCIVCDKRSKPIGWHYLQNHGEHYGARLYPDILLQLKQGKLNTPAHFVPDKVVKCFFKCPFCLSADRLAVTSWFEHFQKHTGECHYQCSKCRSVRSKYSSIQKHVQACGKNAKVINQNIPDITGVTKIKARVCHLCNYIQLCRNNLDRHYVLQHGYKKGAAAIFCYTVVLLTLDDVPWLSKKQALRAEEELRKSYLKDLLGFKEMVAVENIKQEAPDFLNEQLNDEVPVANELLFDDEIETDVAEIETEEIFFKMEIDEIKPMQVIEMTACYNDAESEKAIDVIKFEFKQQNTQQANQPTINTHTFSKLDEPSYLINANQNEWIDIHVWEQKRFSMPSTESIDHPEPV